MDGFFQYFSPLGRMTGKMRGGALVGLWFDGQKHFDETGMAQTGGELPAGEKQPAPAAIKEWLDCYFTGSNPGETPPIAFEGGSPFRQLVWGLLCRIPYGKLITYVGISREIERVTGHPASARAVGGAVGRNPISVIVPCHRVIGSDGSMTGYAGGLTKKILLLRSEGINPAFLAADPARYRFDF